MPVFLELPTRNGFNHVLITSWKILQRNITIHFIGSIYQGKINLKS